MSNVEQTKALVQNTKITSVFDFMKVNEKLIRKSLPSVITPDRMVGIFTMLIKSSPALMQCSQESLVGAVIQTVQLGLQPGNMGHIHLIPFNNNRKVNGQWVKQRECQLIIGYKGYVELINRSGKASILTAEVVYDNDEFEYSLGLNPVLRHVPAIKNRGHMRGVYCIAKNLVANEKVFVYMSADEVLKIKNESLKKVDVDKQKYSPWVAWEDAMWKKTVVRNIAKLLPLSAEQHQSLSADETIKTNIAEDMTSLPDDTKWEDVEANSTNGDSTENHEAPEIVEQPQATTTTTNDSAVSNVEPDYEEPPQKTISTISVKQQKRLYAIAKNAGYKDTADIKSVLMYYFNYEHTADISKDDYEEVCNHFEKNAMGSKDERKEK